jgi:hypothetical protein
VEEGRTFGVDLAAHVPRRVDPAMISSGGSRRGPDPPACARDGAHGPVLVPEGLHPAGDHPSWVPHGARGAAEDLGAWLARLGDARLRADLMGESPDEDVMYPMDGTDDYR